MAAESERPPYLNVVSGQSRGARGAGNAEVASHRAHRSASEGDLIEQPHPNVKSQTQAMSQVPKLSPSLSNTSASPSAPNSAVSSRESSPVRFSSRNLHSSPVSRIQTQSKSRKSSQDRSSPTRSSNGQPSALPIPSGSTSSGQRAQALPGNTPFFSPPVPEPPANDLSPEKSNMPSWAGSRRTDQESTPPNTSHKRASVPPASDDQGKVDRNASRAVTRAGSGQGPSLDTVQEMTSDPSTPSNDTAPKPVTPDDSRLHTIDEDPTPRAAEKNTESGSDSGGNRSSDPKEDSRPNASGSAKPSATIMPKRSTASLSAGARGKPADGSVRNMIVETETVSSIPQVSLGVGAPDRNNASRAEPGNLRKQPSTDTIRPREKWKRSRRPNTVTTGPASSKADIFEAKVASAVDKADVSDSDETFVYESNPTDPYPPRQSRYHSRTPSATSMASQVDQLAGRARGMRDGSLSVTGKRSMKFTNNPNPFNPSLDGEMTEQDGSRSGSRVDGSGTITPRHHNIGRHGRSSGVLPSLFDNDNAMQTPQTQPKSPRHFIGSGYRHSRNSNIRSSPNYRTISNSKKSNEMFDFDAEGADDERTPLVGTPRVPRSRHGRRPNSASLRQMEYMQRQRGCVSRYGSCAIILVLLMIIAGGATTFVIAATKTLLDVQVLAVQNVLASEQEIMLDLNVQAVNPNIFPVTIDDTDVNIFAKSRYVGTDKLWRDHGSNDELDRFPRVKQSQRRWELSQIVRCFGNMDCVREAEARKLSKPHVTDGVDRGTDPVTDPEGDPQTMLLGRVFRFDSPLSFDASPWSYMVSTSKGQIRLPRPGNKTEEGGTERWERVLQHPFELIVRGVIKYQLPLSSRFYSASISSSVKVVPDDDSTTPPSNDTAHATLAKRDLPSVRLLDTDTSPEHRSEFSKRQFTA